MSSLFLKCTPVFTMLASKKISVFDLSPMTDNSIYLYILSSFYAKNFCDEERSRGLFEKREVNVRGERDE